MARASGTQGATGRSRERAVILWWILGIAVANAMTSIYTERRPWAGDALTYWSVWQQSQMYGPLPPRTTGAYLYSPLFAQAMYPLTQLPWVVFCLVWLALSVAAYLWLIRPVGWVWGIPLFMFSLEDIGLGQTTWLVAIAAVVGLTRPWAWAGALFTKVTPAVGMVWFVPRREWRSLTIAVGACSALFAASYVAAPELWAQWFAYLGTHRDASVPIRLMIAAAIMLFAGWRGWAWLLVPALMVVTPVVALYTIGFLCALPRLLPPDAVAWLRQPLGSPRLVFRRAFALDRVEVDGRSAVLRWWRGLGF